VQTAQVLLELRDGPEDKLSRVGYAGRESGESREAGMREGMREGTRGNEREKEREGMKG